MLTINYVQLVSQIVALTVYMYYYCNHLKCAIL